MMGFITPRPLIRPAISWVETWHWAGSVFYQVPPKKGWCFVHPSAGACNFSKHPPKLALFARSCTGPPKTNIFAPIFRGKLLVSWRVHKRHLWKYQVNLNHLILQIHMSTKPTEKKQHWGERQHRPARRTRWHEFGIVVYTPLLTSMPSFRKIPCQK